MKLILFFLLGASIASFLGLVVDRFPEESIVSPRSYCDSCKKSLHLRDLVPIFSQIINKFHCRFCHIRIPSFYCLFEIICGIFFVFWILGFLSGNQLFILLFSSTLAIYDFKYQNYPIVIWLCFTVILLIFTGWNTLVFCLICLGIIAELKDTKIGSGDFFYLATLALTLDWVSILCIIQMASLCGITFCLAYKTRRIPFIPFLFLGYAFCLILAF